MLQASIIFPSNKRKHTSYSPSFSVVNFVLCWFLKIVSIFDQKHQFSLKKFFKVNIPISLLPIFQVPLKNPIFHAFQNSLLLISLLKMTKCQVISRNAAFPFFGCFASAIHTYHIGANVLHLLSCTIEAYETFVYFGQVIFQSEVGWLKNNRNIKSY